MGGDLISPRVDDFVIAGKLLELWAINLMYQA